MADIVHLNKQPKREPTYSDDPTDISVVRFFDDTPFAEPSDTRPAVRREQDELAKFLLPPQFKT